MSATGPVDKSNDPMHRMDGLVDSLSLNLDTVQIQQLLALELNVLDARIEAHVVRYAH